MLALAALLAACGGGDAKPKETADEFVARNNDELREVVTEYQRAAWLQLTYINADTEALAAKAVRAAAGQGRRGASRSRRRTKARRCRRNAARTIELLKLSLSAPAPDDPAKRAELAELETTHDLDVRRRQVLPAGPGKLPELRAISKTLATSRDCDELLDAWKGWHTIAPPMRKDYQRFVELANEGADGPRLRGPRRALARRLRHDARRSSTQETERLWTQVKPLYDGLHCYARGRLQDKYGKERVPDGKPIPAHLFGNMWAQQWNNIYDLLEPYPGVSNLDVTSALEKQELRRRAHDEVRRVLLHLARLPGAAGRRSGSARC